jgi:hypothetical protein
MQSCSEKQKGGTRVKLLLFSEETKENGLPFMIVLKILRARQSEHLSKQFQDSPYSQDFQHDDIEEDRDAGQLM